MASKLKKLFGRKLVALGLIVSIVLPTVYLPSFAPRSQAFLGVGDVTIDSISNILVPIFKGVAQLVAKKMLDDVVQSTIKWANSGFDGNPAFLSQPGNYLGDLAEGAAGEYIRTATTSIISVNGKPKVIELGFLCSPFQARIKLSLIKQIAKPETKFQCTLDQIGANIDNFSRDFTEGGWDAWFAITSSEASDPYGAYIQANASLNSQISAQVDTKKEELAANGGFLNFKVCPINQKNIVPSKDVVDFYEDASESDKAKLLNGVPISRDGKLYLVVRGSWDPDKKAGDCLLKDEDIPVKTPGSVIMAQLNKGLGSGIDKIISADSIDALASAFISGILQRYVFSEKGLADDSSNQAAQEEVVDVDGDKLPDGYDTDGDGQLNICHHGIRNPEQAPSNINCIGSKGSDNSPFFIPICKAADDTAVALKSYKKFLEDNLQWDQDAVRSWQNRTIAAAEAVDNFITTLSRYEINTYDKIVNNFGQYSNHLNVMVSSLIKDGDIKGDGLTPRKLPWYTKALSAIHGGPIGLALIIKDHLLDRGNNGTIARTYLANEQRVTYLDAFKEAIGQCSNPNTTAIDNITIPVGVEGNDSSEPTLSCSPSNTSPIINDPITWYAYSTYNSASTTAYQWTGDSITSAPTTDPQDLNITYTSTGTKSASIKATLSDGSQVTTSCSPGVTVIPRGNVQ